MTIALHTRPPVLVTQIPRLDAAPQYRPAEPSGGIARIVLPSGHLAYHLTRYEHVQLVVKSMR